MQIDLSYYRYLKEINRICDCILDWLKPKDVLALINGLKPIAIHGDDDIVKCFWLKHGVISSIKEWAKAQFYSK